METISDTGDSTQKSHLFMVRFWLEDLGNGRSDWRGKVQHVNSGEVLYFRGWSVLEAFVEKLVLKTDSTSDQFEKNWGNEG